MCISRMKIDFLKNEAHPRQSFASSMYSTITMAYEAFLKEIIIGTKGGPLHSDLHVFTYFNIVSIVGYIYTVLTLLGATAHDSCIYIAIAKCQH